MTETTPEIRFEESGSKGRYVATYGDLPGVEAEMTFSKAGEALIIIDHTEAPEAMRGRGAGKALVTRAVEDARKTGKQILPLCPYARSVFERTPDWTDVWRR